MKKFNLFKIIVYSLLTITNYSCREELTEISPDKTNVTVQASTKNGRLYFPNKESLTATYQNLKNKNIESVQNFIDDTGIESLVPIITQKNENKIISELKCRKIESLKKKSSIMMRTASVSDEDIYDDLDDLEEVVGDEVYAAMLNGNAEIQIANKIYKYTDVGLFVTTEENYSNLENFLEVRKISSNLLVPTDTAIRENFISQTTNNELVTLPNTDNKISYFRSRFPGGFVNTPNIGDSGGFRPSGNAGFRPPNATQESSIESIIQNLPIGEVKKPWLGNIFGKTWTAYDRYEKRRRVKVKFYSQNLYLVYAVGCKVKHQYRGWTGIWRKENADQLGMGINSIEWAFNHQTITSFPPGVPKELYLLGSNMYTSLDGISFTFSKRPNIPPLPFASKLDGIIQFTVNATGLTEEQLDKLFWENAWKQACKFLERENKKLKRFFFIVDSFKGSYVRCYDFSQIENNQDVIERVFDFGIATPEITYTFGGGTGNGIALTSYKWNFSKPDAVAVKMYGIAKKNGAWHGVRLNAR